MAPLIASELVEIAITSGQTSIPIPDQPQLRNQGSEVVVIKGIRLITDKVLAFSPTSGETNAPLADLKNASLILYSNGWERGHLIPVLTLNDMADADSANATTIPFNPQATTLADWENVDWAKSKIQFSNGTSASDNIAIIFQVQYQKFIVNADGTRIQVM